MTTKSSSALQKTLQLGARSIGAVRARLDSWTNLLTGLGSSARDKGTAAEFVRDALLTPEECEDLFHGDDLANRIVSAVPLEALRQGFSPSRVTEEKEGEDADVGEVQESSVALGKRLRELELAQKIQEAMIWGRCSGGAGILLLVKDGGPPEEPLEEGTGTLVGLTVLERQDLHISSYYSDPLENKYGKPRTYRIVPSVAGGGSEVSGLAQVDVHETRLVMFGGVLTSRRERDRNGGWDHSALQRVIHILRGTNTAWDSVIHMMNDFSQAVFKIEGLIEAISEDGQENITKRMALVDMVRSVARAVVVDAEKESFEVVERGALTGLNGVLEQIWLRLSAAARMPVSILMGQAPAGLNATGASDLRWWYDTIRASQEYEVRPRAERIIRMVARELFPELDPDSWTVTFPSLWQMTPAEEAELRSKIAATDKIYIDTGVCLAEEITLSRFGSGAYSSEYVVDLEVRKAVLEADLDKMEEDAKAPPPPPPTPPPPPPAPDGDPPPPPNGDPPPTEEGEEDE